MKKVWPWVIGGIVLIVLAGLIVIGLRGKGERPFVHNMMDWNTPDDRWGSDGATAYDRYPRMGMRSGHRSLRSFGLLGSVLLLLFPLGILTLIVLGIVALLRWLMQSSQQPHHKPVMTCMDCGESLETTWHVCPYCGTPVEEGN